LLTRSSVLTGLSRASEVAKHGRILGLGKIPLFRNSNRIGERKHDTENENESYNGDFYAESISEHIDGKQLSLWERSRRRVVKFQFSWYELIPYGESEDRQFSGRLYRDVQKRSLQLQSFMVSPT